MMEELLNPNYLLDKLSVPLLLIDDNDIIIKVNKATTGFFHCLPQTVLNKKLYQFFQELDISSIKNHIIKHKLSILEKTIHRFGQNNQEIYLKLIISPVMTGKQNYQGAMVICFDISQEMCSLNQVSLTKDKLKLKAIQMAEERDKFHLVIENIGDGVIVIDENFSIIHTNTPLEKIVGLKNNEIINTPLKKYFKEIYYSDLVRKRKYFFTEEIEYIHHADQNNIILMVYIAPIVIQGGTGINYVLTIRDITKQKQLDEMKNQFVSNVSHELRTPLASIKGFSATLLARKNLSDEQKQHFLEIIDSESDRLTRLIEDLLSLAKIESGKFHLQCSKFNLLDVFKSIQHEVQDSLAAKKLTLNIITRKDLPDIIADKDQIFQLFLNLINNAVKFSQADTCIEIKVLYIKKSRIFSITVRDEGPGISREHLKKIFDKFFRVEDYIHTVPGTGLGLSIVKSIIDKHQGSISVKSKIGMGTSFIIQLPQREYLEEA